MRRTVQEKVNALALRVGQMDASVIRLDALGKRLTHMANIDNGEFDFGKPPPEGGEAGADGAPAEIPSLTSMVDRLQTELSSREQQLGVLENLILTRELNKQVYPAGSPVKTGWISSYFGNRSDPFTGFNEFHKGLDIAGPAGTHVDTVAAGVVTWAGPRAGYGNMVEINHGNGLATRYCHNEKLLVKVGEMVHKGERSRAHGLDGPIHRAASAFRSVEERRRRQPAALRRRNSLIPRGSRPSASKRFPASSVYPYNTKFFKDSLACGSY